MSREEFRNMNLDNRMRTLWDEAIVVSEKQYYDCNITLFLLDHFYVEVFFDRVLNEICSIEIQENNEILYAYVSDLSLKELEELLH